jgi:light-harvesting complex 1 beta chain
MSIVHTPQAATPATGALARGGFLLIFMAGYFVILAVALTAQLTGLHWRQWFPGAEGAGSLFSGVKQAVYSFMSFLT